MRKIDEPSNLGNREIFVKNLKYYMGKDNINITELGEKLSKQNKIKIPYSTVRDWCKGVNYPRIDNIEMLANYFGILKSDLTEKKDDTMVPVFTKVSTLSKDIVDAKDNDIIDYEVIPRWWLKDKKRYLAYKITEDSMTPTFQIDDNVIFEITNKYKSGDYCLVSMGDKNSIFRQVTNEKDGFILTPINTKYKSVFCSKEQKIEIIGVAKERRTKLM